jgi:hypothetical protein
VASKLSRVWNRITGQIIGFGVGAAASQAFEPPLRDVTAEIESLFTNRRLDAGTLAQIVMRGGLDPDDAASEAAETGFDRRRFDLLTLLAGEPPSPAETLELLRRGKIDEAEARKSLVQGPLRPEWFDPFLELAQALLSPPELASLAARGIMPEAQARGYAAQQGIAAADFADLVEAARNSPSLGELLDLLNRGEIKEADVTAALEHAGVRDQYVKPLLELRHVLPPVGDLIRFAVREVFTPATRSRYGLDEGFPVEFAQEATKRGLDEQWARAYWAAHWELPSPQQAFAMLHRGLITDADLDRYLISADYMPFWRKAMKGISYLVPGRIDLRRMHQQGVIDRTRVLRGYLDLGYKPEDAELLTDFATREKLAPERDLTKAEVVSLYEARSIPRTQAVELLAGVGYDEAESALILGLADYRHDSTFRSAAVSIVRSRYVAREIDERDVAERLDKVGVPSTERERLLDLWTFQREESPQRLTEAQARAAWKAGIVDESGYRQQLDRIGYPADEQGILVELYRPDAGPKAAPAKDLNRADVLRFYRYGQWQRPQAEAELLRLGYDPTESAALLEDIDRRYRSKGAAGATTPPATP